MTIPISPSAVVVASYNSQYECFARDACGLPENWSDGTRGSQLESLNGEWAYGLPA